MTDLENKVFEDLCKSYFGFHDEWCVNAPVISKVFNITVYRARKVIKNLLEQGLIEKTSIGRPAIESGYECVELECEAMPPLNGYILTSKALCTETYRKAEIEFNQDMEEWSRL